MKVSENRRHLLTDNGEPFFYLADTAWNLLFAIGSNDRRWYFRERQQQGFTVIMTCCVREGGLANARTTTGLQPFVDADPLRPNEPFFHHVDEAVDDAAALGLTIAMLPTWGEYVSPQWATGPKLFSCDSARAYGQFLGNRYKDRPVIWIVGGDRNPLDEHEKEIWRSLAMGLREGDGGRHLITYHPAGGAVDSADFFHNETWLDFNMMQSGKAWDMPNYQYIQRDYQRIPVKPVLEGEAQYENSHEFFAHQPPIGARINAHQVRKAAYNAVLSGAAGHTYGCRDVFSFFEPDGTPVSADINTHWKTAVAFPGASHMGHLRKVMEDNCWHLLCPDTDHKVLIKGFGAGGTFVPTAFSMNEGIALAYFPEIRSSIFDVSILGSDIVARWFNPQTGLYGEPFFVTGQTLFEPDHSPPGPDRVLVLRRAC